VTAAQARDEPVFVCGMGRSGTSWLAGALAQSPELTYVGEAWLVRRLEELAEWFEMLHDEWDGFTPWKRSGVDRRVFVQSLAGWYRDLLTRAAGGGRFVEKTADWNALHLGFLHEMFPGACYVLVYRDGRNCVASMELKQRRAGEPFEFEAACRRWANAMDAAARARTGEEFQRLRLVRYEDLLADFDSIFEQLCAFTGIEPFRPQPREPNSSFPDRSQAGDFDRRWDSWSRTRRRTFERCAGHQLAQWGYEP
jgi:hypothetical protein